MRSLSLFSGGPVDLEMVSSLDILIIASLGVCMALVSTFVRERKKKSTGIRPDTGQSKGRPLQQQEPV